MPLQLNYLKPDSTQTLREAIAELRDAEGVNDQSEEVALELNFDLDVHDAIHCLFACSTNVGGEIEAHVWSAFGTTLSSSEMRRVTGHEDHRKALAEIGHFRLIRTWFTRLPRIIGTIVRSRKMSQRWPAQDFEAFLDRALADIRRDYNIQLPHSRDPASGTSRGAAVRHNSRRRLAATID